MVPKLKNIFFSAVKLGLGWKTYWRNPGESGTAPRFNWENSLNLAAAKIHWPAPRRFEACGYDGFGYHNQVVIPILLTPIIKHQPITARLNLKYMICAKICIPMHARLALKLIEPGPEGMTAPLVLQYLELVPKKVNSSELRITSVTVSGDVGAQILHVRGRSEYPFRAPDLMVEGPDSFAFGRPKITLSANQKLVAMDLPVYTETVKIKLSNQVLTLTIVDDDRALQQRLKVGH